MNKKKDDIAYCPHCGSEERFVPIAYGYPSKEMLEAAESGEISLGGCVIRKGSPSRRCLRCGKSY